MTKSCAVVYIVGSEAGSYKFLEEVSFFIGSFCGTESGEGLWSLIVTNFEESFCGFLHGDFPRDGFEEVVYIFAIDEAVRIFGGIFFSSERGSESVGVRDIVVTESSFDAESVAVCGTVSAVDGDDIVVFDVGGDLASDATVRA